MFVVLPLKGQVLLAWWVSGSDRFCLVELFRTERLLLRSSRSVRTNENAAMYVSLRRKFSQAEKLTFEYLSLSEAKQNQRKPWRR